jgi:hypothetical protein
LSYGVIALEVDRRGSPLFMNVSYSPNNFFQFTSFSQQASTYQTDSSVYTLPASFYSGAPRQTPNITTLSFYRSATNDSFIRNIWNDNVATAQGEASWAGCQSLNTVLFFFRLDLQIDQNFGQYLMCNGGMCPNYYLDVTQRMGANVSCFFVVVRGRRCSFSSPFDFSLLLCRVLFLARHGCRFPPLRAARVVFRSEQTTAASRTTSSLSRRSRARAM